MRSLAVVHPDITSGYKLLSKNRVHNTEVAFALLEINVNLDSHLSEDMVLVRKTAFSVNYREKGLCITAHLELIEEEKLAGYFPVGSEFAGVVIKAGSDVKDFKPGDRVMPNHAYPHSGYSHVRPGVISNQCSNEYAIFHFSKLVAIPESMDDITAAAFSLGAQTAYSMIRKVDLHQGQQALVTAASSNTSLFIIAGLIAKGIETHIITTQQKHRQFFLDMGVHTVYFNNRDLPFDDPQQEFMQDKIKFDAVLDPLFDIYLFEVLERIRSNGKYTTCGRYDQFSGLEKTERKDMIVDMANIVGFIMNNNISLIGNCLGQRSDLENAIIDFKNGKLHVNIAHVCKEEELSSFIDHSFNEKDLPGKVVYLYA